MYTARTSYGLILEEFEADSLLRIRSDKMERHDISCIHKPNLYLVESDLNGGPQLSSLVVHNGAAQVS